LSDGRALITGGYTGTQLTRAEIFELGSGWSLAPDMQYARAGHSSALLPDGRALVLAGHQTLKFAEIFTPATNAWAPAGSTLHAGQARAATELLDGSVLVTGGYENFVTGLEHAEIFKLLDNGTACSDAATCKSGFCADGVCCNSVCNGVCMSCNGGVTGGASGTCAPVQAGSDPQNHCKDSGTPACLDNGWCDGAGACQKYAQSASCTPQSCSSGAECASGVCADGICCDKACGTCQACTAAKKGFGIDGVCAPVAADTDPDDECEQGPNYPTSCLADGMCDGTGKCRAFAKDTVSCGATQCSSGSAEGLLCNGAGQCLTAKTSCEPYVCQNDACVQQCADDNDCVSTAYCNTQNACSTKLAKGSGCSSGKECQSGFCVDAVCCDQSCSGQCEACNVAPNEGSCVAVLGTPIAPRPACAGEGGECGGSCDGINRNACVLPPSGEQCGSASCASAVQSFSACDGKGACIAATRDCSPYACAGSECRADCSDSAHCAQGFDCDVTTKKCIPVAGTCAADGVTLESSNGQSKDCTPYRCLGGECAAPCATSSQCVSGYACDQGQCVALGDDPAAEDDGCGCRIGGSSRTDSAALCSLLAAIALLCLRRRTRSACSRQACRAARRHVHRSGSSAARPEVSE
jgi:hypothetical protein